MMRGVGRFFRKNPFHFHNFLHEVVFIWHPTCGIDDEQIGPLFFCPFIRFKSDASGVTSGRATDDGYGESFSPDLKLIDGGSTEGVAGSEHDCFTLIQGTLREFGGRGCFSTPVDTDKHDDFRFIEDESIGWGFEEFEHLGSQKLFGGKGLFEELLGGESGGPLLGEGQSEIGFEQKGFPIDLCFDIGRSGRVGGDSRNKFLNEFFPKGHRGEYKREIEPLRQYKVQIQS